MIYTWNVCNSNKHSRTSLLRTRLIESSYNTKQSFIQNQIPKTFSIDITSVNTNAR